MNEGLNFILRNRPMTMNKPLITEASAFNKRGPCWNSGASHMDEALKVKDFQEMGLFRLFENVKGKQISAI